MPTVNPLSMAKFHGAKIAHEANERPSQQPSACDDVSWIAPPNQNEECGDWIAVNFMNLRARGGCGYGKKMTHIWLEFVVHCGEKVRWPAR